MGRASRKVDSRFKPIVNLIESMNGSRSMYQIFNDCIECMAISISNRIDIFSYDKREKDYLAIINGYSEKDIHIMTQIAAEVVNTFENEPFQDFFSSLYMSLDMGSDALGQVFTPWSLCQMMANICIDIDEVKRDISKKGYFRINEPSCGAGAIVIGALEYLHNNGINYQKQCVIVCQDLSRIAGLQCYISLSLLGASAVIKIGDTLCNPYTNYKDERRKGSELWLTPMCILNGDYLKI